MMMMMVVRRSERLQAKPSVYYGSKAWPHGYMAQSFCIDPCQGATATGPPATITMPPSVLCHCGAEEKEIGTSPTFHYETPDFNFLLKLLSDMHA